jgi:hypothetical protein
MLAGRSEPPFRLPPRTAIDPSEAAAAMRSYNGFALEPETWTHGLSEQRVRALPVDYDAGHSR